MRILFLTSAHVSGLSRRPGRIVAKRTLNDLPGPRGLPFLGNIHQLDLTKLHRQDIYQAAFRRLGQIEGKDHEDIVVRQFWVAVSAVEECLRQKHGKSLKANYTRRKAARVGEVACLNDWALMKQETEGFKMLVAAGLADLTGEYIVVKNPDRFSPEAVAAATQRLVDHHVLPAG